MPQARDCGACNACCKVLGVPDISKPAHMLCWWTDIHGGCQRHGEKQTAPELEACAQFKCLWLASQTQSNFPLPRHLRPDISKVLMGPYDREDDTLLYVHMVDPHNEPGAWRQPEIGQYLQDIVGRGGKVELVIGQTRMDLTADGRGVLLGMSEKTV